METNRLEGASSLRLKSDEIVPGAGTYFLADVLGVPPPTFCPSGMFPHVPSCSPEECLSRMWPGVPIFLDPAARSFSAQGFSASVASGEPATIPRQDLDLYIANDVVNPWSCRHDQVDEAHAYFSNILKTIITCKPRAVILKLFAKSVSDEIASAFQTLSTYKFHGFAACTWGFGLPQSHRIFFVIGFRIGTTTERAEEALPRVETCMRKLSSTATTVPWPTFLSQYGVDDGVHAGVHGGVREVVWASVCQGCAEDRITRVSATAVCENHPCRCRECRAHGAGLWTLPPALKTRASIPGGNLRTHRD